MHMHAHACMAGMHAHEASHRRHTASHCLAVDRQPLLLSRGEEVERDELARPAGHGHAQLAIVVLEDGAEGAAARHILLRRED